jgi:TonB family protein
MKHRSLFFIASVLMVCTAIQAQDSIQTRKLTKTVNGSVETFNVRLSDEKIWHGPFTCSYNNELLIAGSYDNDRLDGEWKYYYPGKKLKAVALYSKGRYVKSLGAYYPDGTKECDDSIAGKKEFVRIYTDKSKLNKEIIYFNGIRIRETVYYPASGKIKTISSKDDPDTSFTRTTHFYENGGIRSILLLKNSNPYTGEACFDPSGKPLDQGNLKDGIGLLKTYQDTAVVFPESNVTYQNGKKNGEAVYFQANGKSGMKGFFVNDLYQGKWTYYALDGKVDHQSTYDTTSRIIGTPSLLPASRNDLTGDLMPDFPGGTKALYRFLAENIKYPTMESENGIQGTVYIGFEVFPDGFLDNLKVLKSVKGGPGLEKEALRVIKKMPPWVPAIVEGKPVKVQYFLPVKFVMR